MVRGVVTHLSGNHSNLSY